MVSVENSMLNPTMISGRYDEQNTPGAAPHLTGVPPFIVFCLRYAWCSFGRGQRIEQDVCVWQPTGKHTSMGGVIE